MNQIEICSKHSDNRKLENILTNLEEHPVRVAYQKWERVCKREPENNNFAEFLRGKFPEAIVIDLNNESIGYKKIFT